MDEIKKIISTIWHGVKKLKQVFKLCCCRLWRWLKGLMHALHQLWRALGPVWLRSLLIVLLVIVFVYGKILQFVKPNLTRENILSLHYLNSGWSEAEREDYYYTPQGTELLGVEYAWFINLELPLSHDLLATETNMRGWGFIVAPGQRSSIQNPGNLPVGLGRHIDPQTGREHLDIGCATCHTGELHYKGVALRVDGGQAVQSIANARRGEFITTFGASVLETLYNPAKWDRFATRVVGEDKTQRKQLKKRFKQFAKKLRGFTEGAGAAKYYPVEEGRGRTDAVGRIGNVVFGYDLDEPKNYRVADAPVSYPFLWDIWRFDWVQYTGFTNQAMARNVGESLGVLAPIELVNKKGELIKSSEFGETLVNIDGMHCVETILRKLKPPAWPESILGKINIEKATQGKHLFQEQCSACHGPHVSPSYAWKIATKEQPYVEGQANVNWRWDSAGELTHEDNRVWRQDQRTEMWALPWVATDVIGTDPKLADNYMDHRYDASKLIPGSEPLNAGDGLQALLNILVPDLYQRWEVESPAQVASFDGLNAPFRIANKRAYKARPLHGVWATPPFLHNGSVPTIYDLLSPLRERPRTFYVGNREYDPQKLGYETAYAAGAFLHDTSIKGNQNIGHLFTDLASPGRIGRLLTEDERYALLEYIKVMGNPAFDKALGGDPLNWNNYSSPPPDPYGEQACKSLHMAQFDGADL